MLLFHYRLLRLCDMCDLSRCLLAVLLVIWLMEEKKLHLSIV